MLLNLLKSQAVRRGLLDPAQELDPAQVFYLVRDMPYRRASNRRPETIILEWQGTCSGKHYLLQALFQELGLEGQVIACTTITPIAAENVRPDLLPLYEVSNRRFVDVHNYLQLNLPDGRRMKVDATWPRSAAAAGLRVNDSFVLGEDHRLAADPLDCWEIPPGRDPQEFKDELLQAHFSPAELAFREEVIRYLGEKTSA